MKKTFWIVLFMLLSLTLFLSAKKKKKKDQPPQKDYYHKSWRNMDRYFDNVLQKRNRVQKEILKRRKKKL